MTKFAEFGDRLLRSCNAIPLKRGINSLERHSTKDRGHSIVLVSSGREILCAVLITLFTAFSPEREGESS